MPVLHGSRFAADDTVLEGPILATFTEGQQRADRTSTTSSEELPAFSGCSWCPVCALAAAIRGEHHELLAGLAGHVANLLALLREFLDKILGVRDGGPCGTAVKGADPKVARMVPCRQPTVPPQDSLARPCLFRST
ncbi:hypothetical protein [Rhodococcus sp. KBS0724]|jgi:hypothetical protein|uniref:hypothetical protein n=1 Tax=Rhodococcus sp. KBS0724 TaxID=1179674 RepID=UPI00163D99D5|nr:hypothetical protein [Rhodococcus sp. KBS0724]